MVQWFVTGTDTGVGKTAVAACLAEALASLAPTLAMKPIASGVAPGSAAEDAVRLAAAAKHPPMVRYALREPLSPHRAAAAEGVEIDAAGLIDWIRLPAATHRIVEGVGGWRVPLAPHFDVRDLAIALAYPVLVVVQDRLGAINHALLTVESVRDAGLQLAGVVLNRGTSSVPIASNLADLVELTGTTVVPCEAVDLSSASARHAAGTRLLECLLGDGTCP